MLTKRLFVLTIAWLLVACSTQLSTQATQSSQATETSDESTSIEEADYIADEGSVGVEYTARDILNKGETFTPNKVYFVRNKIKASALKTTQDSGNLRQQDKYRRHDQKYLLGFFGVYLKDNRFSLICSPIKYGLFGSSEVKDESGNTLEEYLFSLFEGSKLIGVMFKPENHALSRKCFKYRKQQSENKTNNDDKYGASKKEEIKKVDDKAVDKHDVKPEKPKKEESKKDNKTSDADEDFEEEQRKSSIFN